MKKYLFKELEQTYRHRDVLSFLDILTHFEEIVENNNIIFINDNEIEIHWTPRHINLLLSMLGIGLTDKKINIEDGGGVYNKIQGLLKNLFNQDGIERCIDESVYSSLIKIACQLGQINKIIWWMDKMKSLNLKIKPRTIYPIFEALIDYSIMMKNESILNGYKFIMNIFRNRLDDWEIKLKDIHYINILRLIQGISNSQHKIDENVLEIVLDSVKNNIASIDFAYKSTMDSLMEYFGYKCKILNNLPICSCGYQLQKNYLTFKERKIMLNILIQHYPEHVKTQLYKCRKNILKFVKNKFQSKKQKILSKNETLNQEIIILDGGNIGYYNNYYRVKSLKQSKNISTNQIYDIWKYFSQRNKKVILFLNIVHNKKTINSLKTKINNNGLVYFTPKGIDDDLFWLWIGINFTKSLIITNDKLGNYRHKFSTSEIKLFDKFYDTQTTRYTMKTKSHINKKSSSSSSSSSSSLSLSLSKNKQKLKINEPDLYSINIQGNNKSIHIPYCNNHDKKIVNWICYCK